MASLSTLFLFSPLLWLFHLQHLALLIPCLLLSFHLQHLVLVPSSGYHLHHVSPLPHDGLPHIVREISYTGQKDKDALHPQRHRLANSKHWFTTSFLQGRCRKAMLRVWQTRWLNPKIKLQALVYDILPSTTAVFSYATGSRKLSANEQFFVGAQTVVRLLQTTQTVSDVCFITDHVAYTSRNKPQTVWIETDLFLGWMRLMFMCVLGRYRLLP